MMLEGWDNYIPALFASLCLRLSSISSSSFLRLSSSSLSLLSPSSLMRRRKSETSSDCADWSIDIMALLRGGGEKRLLLCHVQERNKTRDAHQWMQVNDAHKVLQHINGETEIRVQLGSERETKSKSSISSNLRDRVGRGDRWHACRRSAITFAQLHCLHLGVVPAWRRNHVLAQPHCS